LPLFSFEAVPIKTAGDRDKLTPLSVFEKSDFFTYEIEKALLNGTIDAALHSAKDLEEMPPVGLVVAAMTRSISASECLISKEGLGLDKLPLNSVIGTSSRARRASIIRFRRDLKVKDIRGNVDERIGQLDAGGFDAIIVAHAALIRLGYEDRISEIIPQDIVRPHPLQGRLSVQVNINRPDMIRLFRSIDERS